ncbi:MAG: hypothetical protein R3C55_02225 [Parvularculaceae bacterium]
MAEMAEAALRLPENLPGFARREADEAGVLNRGLPVNDYRLIAGIPDHFCERRRVRVFRDEDEIPFSSEGPMSTSCGVLDQMMRPPTPEKNGALSFAYAA